MDRASDETWMLHRESAQWEYSIVRDYITAAHNFQYRFDVNVVMGIVYFVIEPAENPWQE